jgi:hypothetical protein
MPKVCGQLEALEPPRGGGVSTTTVKYVDTGERRTYWTKHRMVFPLIRIGGQELKNYWVASDTLGTEIAEGARTGEKVCLHYYGHLLTRKVIIGLTSASGSQVMPRKGFLTGLFWYGVFSPLVLLIPYAVGGMLLGMLGGKQGTAMGLLFGVLGAVGVSWFSGYRLYKAYHELESEPRLAPGAVPASR